MQTVRRFATVLAGLAAPLLLAGPASADVPELWPENEPVDPLNAILVLGGIPLLLLAAITLAVYLPSLMRGENVTPGSSVPDDQWIGGPRPAAGELADPDSATSEAGGASGRW